MYRLIPALTLEDRRRFCRLACPSNLTLDMVERQRPDALWMVEDREGTLAARGSLWWTATPSLNEHRPGLIGHYAATNAEASAVLLDRACREFADRRCTLAIGPMDGNTWQRYRLLTERGAEPAFFLEPDNPDDWPVHFQKSGFTPLAQYYSALNDNLGLEDPRLADIAQRVRREGIVVRPLDPGRFEEELRAIHALSLASFSGNLLYSPIRVEDFIAQYRGVRDYVRPELVLLAEQGHRLAGFIFAIPDLLQARRGQAVDTVVIKTMAVHPDRAGMGLGTLLMGRCQAAAHACGYRRAIHALFHEANASGKISRHTARVIRRYTLFAKLL